VIRWTVELRPVARRELRLLDDGPKRDAAALIADLTEDPMQVAAREMRHYQNTWKARFYHDQYRIIYRIARAQRRIVVIRIRPRGTAYEGMKG